MIDMWNVAFQNAWFGPFAIPLRTPPNCKKIIGPMGHPVYQDPDCIEYAGPVHDEGPMDGLMTTSMWAQQFAQIPIINYAQARPRMQGLGQVKLCPPGEMPIPSGVPGQPSKCVKWSPPSNMIGPNSQAPPSYTQNQITYAVQNGYNWNR